MLETSWLWFVISKEYVELTRPKIESRDPIFFTGTRSRSRVSGNDRLFPRGSEFGPNLEIPAGPAIQLRPGPCPKTVDSPNTVLQKITGGIFCKQFVQRNDGGARW